MQTEGKIESAVRKEQSDVGMQTDSQTDGKMLAKRKGISPNVDSQARALAHMRRYVSGEITETLIAGDAVSLLEEVLIVEQ